jgi:uncharacterized protein
MSTSIIITILLIGLAAGILSGLVGVGGGIILVPALILFMHYSQHQAQGTSLGVLSIPVVLLAFLQYYKHGKETGTPIDLKIIGILAIGFVIGGFVGSSLAVRLDQSLIKKIFAAVLFYTGIKMMGWDTAIMKLFK